jgi:phosphate starvation-inducible PhoH-like protein
MKKETSDLKSLTNFYKPKTPNQEKYVKYLNSDSTKLLFAVGPAGTGKTMLACNHAIKELKDGNIEKIIITRPIIPVEEEEIGFLPGNINKKMDPWMTPIFDIFNEFYVRKDIESMIFNNIIEVSPLAFMRGRTFKNSFVIADEMQNSSPNQMLMLTTRIGENSKMVITGDLKQSDRGINSGLSDFINKYKTYNNYLTSNNKNTKCGIDIIELTNEDIERSKIVSKILDIYNLNENKPSIKDNVTMPRENTSIVPYKNNDAALMPLYHLSKNYK